MLHYVENFSSKCFICRWVKAETTGISRLQYKLLPTGAGEKRANFRISGHCHVQYLPQIKTLWFLPKQVNM